MSFLSGGSVIGGKGSRLVGEVRNDFFVFV